MMTSYSGSGLESSQRGEPFGKIPGDSDSESVQSAEEDDQLNWSDIRGSAELNSSEPQAIINVIGYSWNKLYSLDEKERRSAMNLIRKRIKSVIHQTSNQPSDVVSYLIRPFLPRIVRLAYECPFPDVKKGCMELLQEIVPDLKAKKLPVPKPVRPSRYYDASILPIDTDLEPQASVFKELFLHTGKEAFLEAYNFIMRADAGSLTYPYRFYIAIIASARYRCAYPISQLEQDFEVSGGDPEWLLGVHKLPPKLAKILEVNAILAHQPWLLSTDHIDQLVKGDDIASRWSYGELVHAITIMATFRGISMFAHGMGLNQELEFTQWETEKSDSDSETLETTSESANADLLSKITQVGEADDECDEAERQTQFEQAESNETSTDYLVNDAQFDKYIGPYTITHADFDVKSKAYPILHVQEYRWEEQGFDLMQRYYSDCAELLDKEFNCIQELTDHSLNDKIGVDTSPYRRAIWYYVHRVAGILHDDYNYENINKVLDMDTKTYCKVLVTQPFAITPSMVKSLSYLKPHERSHVTLLAAEARKQAELVYALQAISRSLSF